MKVAVSFTLTYTLEIPEQELSQYENDIKEWVFDNALPDVRYPDHSGNNSFICIPAFKRVGWDWSGEYDDFEVKLEEDSE